MSNTVGSTSGSDLMRSPPFLYSPVVRLWHPRVGAFTTRINEPPDEGLYGPSGVSSKAANWGQIKTGQRKWPGTVRSFTRS